MRKRRTAAVRQRTLVVNQRGRMKTRNKEKKKRMRKEGREGGKQVAAEARAARREPEKCETRKRSSAVMTTATTTNPRTPAGAAGRRAAEVRTKEATEAAAGAAVPPRHTATAAVTIQRLRLRAEAEVRGAQTQVTPVIANEICSPGAMLTATYLMCVQRYPVTYHNISSVWSSSCKYQTEFMYEIVVAFGLGISLKSNFYL